MTPFEMIRLGIATNDMKVVQKAYKLMSGEKIGIGSECEDSPPQDKEEVEYIAKINANLSGGLTRKIPLQLVKRNLFTDAGERGDKLPGGEKPARKKKVDTLFVKVTCKNCQEVFTVNKQLLPISVDDKEKLKVKAYTCDDCLAGNRR